MNCNEMNQSQTETKNKVLRHALAFMTSVILGDAFLKDCGIHLTEEIWGESLMFPFRDSGQYSGCVGNYKSAARRRLYK